MPLTLSGSGFTPVSLITLPPKVSYTSSADFALSLVQFKTRLFNRLEDCLRA